ncbi:MAG: RluA family pseudouridine synthase [Oligoflexia bacterium]|nr:RluA family pseudouridine synthase [Oligoflexia bacterium]
MPRLDAVVRNRHQTSWGKARGWIESGKIWIDGRAVTDCGAEVAEDAVIELRMNAPKGGARPAAGSGVSFSKAQIVYSDSQLVVVNKPAGISTVPYEGERGSLEEALSAHLKQRVVVVHRLDRETSGLLVFARNQEAGRMLANQFRFHTVKRRYFAIVLGKAYSQTIRSLLVENRGDGLRGSIPKASGISRDEAKEAVTHVAVLESFERQGFTLSLIECRLETGRTHQIRIHLSEAGHPLVGEKAYIREYPGARPEAPRLLLHAAELGLVHPLGGDRHWMLAPPQDFLGYLSVSAREKVRRSCERITHDI